MQLNNLLLLQVKMFLSEFPWIRNQKYVYPYRVCTHFTKDVFDKATVTGMRCACAIIGFKNMDVSHAIVAFETDHGLIYIEPQSGGQESISVGEAYQSRLDGVPTDNVVSSVHLMWNDKNAPYWLECLDCGYILPTDEIECPIVPTVVAEVLGWRFPGVRPNFFPELSPHAQSSNL